MTPTPEAVWNEDGVEQRARWRSEGGVAPPKRIVIADDRMPADAAYKLACEGTALLWRGDYQNARQLLQALARRIDKRGGKKKQRQPLTPTEAFHTYRQVQIQRAHILGMLLLPCDADYRIALRRAPDVRQACHEAWGLGEVPSLVALRELLGLIGAHEWRKKGVEIPALGARIHPHYGVFSPVRGEYLELVARAPLPPACKLAFDIGTGTGVLAALLAKRGVGHVVATEMQARALACARENIVNLGMNAQVEIVEADLFPPGRAALIVCNPPWVPARANSPLDHAVFDPDSRMLKGFLNDLAAHLEPGGEGWLILSDLAEHLGLRPREQLLALIDAAGLKVVGKIDIKPHHPRTGDQDDPLHAARAAEITSLWRLAAAR